MTLTGSSIRPPISMAILDVTGITSDLLNRAFARQPEYVVVGCPRNIEETVRIVIEKRPDAVIVSVFDQSGFHMAMEFLGELSLIGSATRGIILSAHLTNEEAVAYFQAQARGVLSGSSADFPVLCKCVTCVHSGQIWANSEQMVCLVKSLSQSTELKVVNTEGLPILSAREEEVLLLLSEGLSNRDMAAALKLSEHTVRNHLFHIFDKLGVSSRMEAVLYGFNHRNNPVPRRSLSCSAKKPALRDSSEAYAVNQ